VNTENTSTEATQYMGAILRVFLTLTSKTKIY